MSESASYSVVTSGELQDGFEPEQVRDALVALFKLPPEKAAALLTREQMVKKNVDLETAELFKKKLESMGLIVALKSNEAPPPDPFAGLSLVPTEEATAEEQAHGEPVLAPAPAPKAPVAKSDTFPCPKCGKEQPKGAEQCQDCGVYVNKVPGFAAGVAAAGGASAAGAAQATYAAPQDDDEEDEFEPEGIAMKSLAAAAAAALVGALVWKFIGLTFNFELGLVAWGIGGLIGFAAAVTGGSGDKMAIACAVLALVAILGGKYMLAAGYKDQLSGQFEEVFADAGIDVREGLRETYDEMVIDAEDYGDVSDDESLRKFMVNNGYSESSAPNDVSDEEVSDFQEYSGPELREFSNSQPSFNDWSSTLFSGGLDSISNFDLFKESFGALDLLFLFLGVGTAFRLGRGEEK